MKRGLAVLVVAGLAYLLFWPVPIAPVAWTPPPVVGVPLNARLKSVEWLHKDLQGPEAIAFDSDGGLLTGLDDGRVVRVAGEHVSTVAQTHGKVLGLKFSPEGTLYLCAASGLLKLEDGKVETLSEPFVFADDLDFGSDGAVYFSDASQNHDVRHFVDDLLEHQTTGRLMRYDPKTKQTTVRADGLQFANGVAAGPDRAWVVVAETGNYRLTRVDLSDGRKTVFADSLPGFPDNVTWSPERQLFWVAIGSPRDPAVDALAPWPFLRKVVMRLPKAVQPKPQAHATVLGYDVNGKLVENLQWKDPAAYSPIASVVEHDGALYLGSFALAGYGRYRLPDADLLRTRQTLDALERDFSTVETALAHADDVAGLDRAAVADVSRELFDQKRDLALARAELDAVRIELRRADASADAEALKAARLRSANLAEHAWRASERVALWQKLLGASRLP